MMEKKYEHLSKIIGRNIGICGFLFANKKKFSLNEDELNALEEILAKKEEQQSLQTEIAEELNSTKNLASTLSQEKENIIQQLDKILKQHNITPVENIAENIELLNKKCGEYGKKQPTHSLLPVEGTDCCTQPSSSVVDPNDTLYQTLRTKSLI